MELFFTTIVHKYSGGFSSGLWALLLSTKEDILMCVRNHCAVDRTLFSHTTVQYHQHINMHTLFPLVHWVSTVNSLLY